MFLRELHLMRDQVGIGVAHPFNIPALRGLDKRSFRSNVTFFTGENGSGVDAARGDCVPELLPYGRGGDRNNAYELEASEADLGGAIRLSFLPNTSQIIFLGVESFNSIHQSSPKRLRNGNFSFYLLGMAPIYGLNGKSSI